MWQADTFDSATIDRELAMAQNIGMNSMRVYLHHLAWQQDVKGFKHRINEYLRIANKHGIKTMFVFFDDCWADNYTAGKQPAPVPSVHNSQWLKDPGGLIDREPELMDTLEIYVKDILKTFGNDQRIFMWDLYNEPGHFGRGNKSWPLLHNVVKWARVIHPSQPITMGVWNKEFKDFNTFQLENSDVITFHNYRDTNSLKQALDTLTKMGKPVICTEYMKRPTGSTFQNCLPIFKRYHVGAINWGLVAGKTQTNYPQGNKGGEQEPEIWYHDIFRENGVPFDKQETDLIFSFK
jgi:endo-1,4-beta-mannosidase